MKRPLLLCAVFLTLCCLLFRDEGRLLLLFPVPRPEFTRITEGYDSDFRDCVFTGVLTRAYRKNGRFVGEVRPEGFAGTVYCYFDEKAAEDEVACLFGSGTEFRGRFFSYQGPTNFGEFDLSLYYEATGVYGGVLLDSFENARTRGDPVRTWAFRFRNRIDDYLSMASPEHFGFYKSLLLKDRTDLDTGTEETVEALGLTTLLGTSGFYFSAFGILLYDVLKKRCRTRRIPAASSTVLMLGIGFLTGFSVSFIRAFIIFLFRIIAPLVKRKFDLLSASSLAMIMLLSGNSLIARIPAFQFGAMLTFGLGAVYPALKAYAFSLNRRNSFLIRVLVLKAVFLPLTVYNTFRPGLYSLFTEPFSFGFKTLLTMMLTAASFLGVSSGTWNPFSTLIMKVADLFTDGLNAVLDLISQLPFATYVSGEPPHWKLILYGLLLAGLFLFFRIQVMRRKRMKEDQERIPEKPEIRICLTLFCLIAFGTVFLRADPVANNELRLTAIDVGQGDGFLLETASCTILIDGGSTDREDVGKTIVNTIHYFGKSSVDAVFLSHGDTDHVSGVKTILKDTKTEVKRLYLPDVKETQNDFAEIIELASLRGTEIAYLGIGDLLEFKDLKVHVLWPAKGSLLSGNDASLVLSVSRNDTDLLFTGDVSSEIESRLSIRHAYEFLKVPHHGSAGSSSSAFLQAVDADLAVVSYGKNNPYGHPKEEAVKRITDSGAVLFGTGRDGAVSILYEGNQATVVKKKVSSFTSQDFH